VTNQTLHWD